VNHVLLPYERSPSAESALSRKSKIQIATGKTR
jgi:hypothetical protein